MRRRPLLALAPAWALGAAGLPGCAPAASADDYATAVSRIWRTGPLAGLHGQALAQELVRYATLAPSSHNTQCWTFAVDAAGITVAPDLSRRCPAVDPDDHHLWVSLGAAVENLAQAALAHGLLVQAQFRAERPDIRLTLSPTAALASPSFLAIASRQSTRGNYDGQPLSLSELQLLERTGSSPQVRVLMLTARADMERVLAHVLAGNNAQLADPAFMQELKKWVRFNQADVLRTGDGLFTRSSGHPSVPAWLGQWAFERLITPRGEGDRYAAQVRSSAGLAVFVAQVPDPAHWVEVGRCFERFALQATALGIRTAHLNQPVEVLSIRSAFAADWGLAGQRPDLVLRFGRGTTLPPSLRRPVRAVLL
jgi:hypothetical protein